VVWSLIECKKGRNKYIRICSMVVVNILTQILNLGVGNVVVSGGTTNGPHVNNS
jgi:hypothetical protein